MDSIDFDTFNSPANGVELSDTFNDWRKKTNGIIEKADNISSGDISDGSIVLEKIEDIGAKKVIGNTNSTSSSPFEIPLLDEDTMASNRSDALVTQQSFKAYSDNEIEKNNIFNDQGRYIHSFHVFHHTDDELMIRDNYLINADWGERSIWWDSVGVCIRQSDGSYEFGELLVSRLGVVPDGNTWILTKYDQLRWLNTYTIEFTHDRISTISADDMQYFYGTYNNGLTPYGFRDLYLVSRNNPYYGGNWYSYKYCIRVEERSHADPNLREVYWFGDTTRNFTISYANTVDNNLLNDGVSNMPYTYRAWSKLISVSGGTRHSYRYSLNKPFKERSFEYYSNFNVVHKVNSTLKQIL